MDVSLFGLRFKVIETSIEDDPLYNIKYITKIEDINSDEIFLLLSAQGYLAWLREQVSTNAFLKVIQYRDRWVQLIDEGIKTVVRDRKGNYLLQKLKGYKRMPLIHIYNEQPDLFDWILR